MKTKENNKKEKMKTNENFQVGDVVRYLSDKEEKEVAEVVEVISQVGSEDNYILETYLPFRDKIVRSGRTIIKVSNKNDLNKLQKDKIIFNMKFLKKGDIVRPINSRMIINKSVRYLYLSEDNLEKGTAYCNIAMEKLEWEERFKLLDEKGSYGPLIKEEDPDVIQEVLDTLSRYGLDRYGEELEGSPVSGKTIFRSKEFPYYYVKFLCYKDSGKTEIEADRLGEHFLYDPYEKYLSKEMTIDNPEVYAPVSGKILERSLEMYYKYLSELPKNYSVIYKERFLMVSDPVRLPWKKGDQWIIGKLKGTMYDLKEKVSYKVFWSEFLGDFTSNGGRAGRRQKLRPVKYSSYQDQILNYREETEEEKIKEFLNTTEDYEGINESTITDDNKMYKVGDVIIYQESSTSPRIRQIVGYDSTGIVVTDVNYRRSWITTKGIIGLADSHEGRKFLLERSDILIQNSKPHDILATNSGEVFILRDKKLNTNGQDLDNNYTVDSYFSIYRFGPAGKHFANKTIEDKNGYFEIPSDLGKSRLMAELRESEKYEWNHVVNELQTKDSYRYFKMGPRGESNGCGVDKVTNEVYLLTGERSGRKIEKWERSSDQPELSSTYCFLNLLNIEIILGGRMEIWDEWKEAKKKDQKEKKMTEQEKEGRKETLIDKIKKLWK